MAVATLLVELMAVVLQSMSFGKKATDERQTEKKSMHAFYISGYDDDDGMNMDDHSF